jgi:lipopolysaccharide biosynthesis glycosyltransferase
VVLAADERYLPGLLACARGVVDHGGSASLVVFDCGLTASTRQALRAIAGDRRRLELVRPRLDDALLRGARHPPASYVRMLIARHSLAYDRVLYLDVDTVVVGDLAPLLGLDLRGRAVAAVKDFHTPVVSARDGLADWRSLGLPSDAPFFNSGVLLIDLERWREDDVERASIRHMRRYHRLDGNDQHALNAALAGRWRELSPMWNATRYWFKPERRPGRFAGILWQARVVHYVGPHKPWVAGADLPAAEVERFFRILDRTPLAGWRPGTPSRPRDATPRPVAP